MPPTTRSAITSRSARTIAAIDHPLIQPLVLRALSEKFVERLHSTRPAVATMPAMPANEGAWSKDVTSSATPQNLIDERARPRSDECCGMSIRKRALV
eukprot:2839390-Prymnesium_polylepis.1